MDAARTALVEENATLKAERAVARAKASEDMALIAAQKLRIAKLERQVYGQRSERSARLIDQLALAFEELEASATEDELAAEKAVAKATTVAGFTRKRPERDTFPEHLPRERVVIEAPTACACCGGQRLRKLGEDVTRTLETTPRQWKVIETVREKFSCRDCEKITQVPVHINKVHHVKTITSIARELGENEDWLFDVAIEMEPEDGVIWVYGVDDEGEMAFTDFGIENLIDLIKIHKDDPTILARRSR